MNKQLIFIDDSGDPGFKSTSSANFVISAVLFTDSKIAMNVSKCISGFRKSLGWRHDNEFKFSKVRKDIVIELLGLVSKYDLQVYAVYIDKSNFKYVSQIIDQEKLYNWTIKELLITIPVEEAKIKIDGRSSKRNMLKTATYLRRELNINSRKVEIKFEDSVNDNLIQLADLIAGSINRSINKDKTDTKTYINIVKHKVRQIKQIK